MNEIAYFMETSSISYTAIFAVLGAAAALVCTIITAALFRHRMAPVMAGAAISIVTAVLCSRLTYWYFNQEQYDGFLQAMTDFRIGGFSMAGVFPGVIIAAVIVRAAGLTDNLAALLDCYAPGGALGIAVGRLGGFFTADDKGNYVFDDPRYHGLPFSFPVQDSATGAVEWRFASFFWESMAGFVIFGALLVIILRQPDDERQGADRRGDVFMAFLSLYGAAQATLESTRYDALRMRSNGFISVMQLAALIMLLIPLIYYSARTVRIEKRIKPIMLFCVIAVAALADAGIAEYFAQRKTGHVMIILPLQLVSLLICSLMTLLTATRLYRNSERE